MDKKYVKPTVKKYGDLETVILSGGKSAKSCKTDCRQLILGKPQLIYKGLNNDNKNIMVYVLH